MAESFEHGQGDYERNFGFRDSPMRTRRWGGRYRLVEVIVRNGGTYYYPERAVATAGRIPADSSTKVFACMKNDDSDVKAAGLDTVAAAAPVDWQGRVCWAEKERAVAWLDKVDGSSPVKTRVVEE